MDRVKRKLLIKELGKLIDTGITEKDKIKGLEEKGIDVSLSKNLTFDTYGSNIITFKSTEDISEQLENDLSNVNFANLNQATKQAIADMVNGNI